MSASLRMHGNGLEKNLKLRVSPLDLRAVKAKSAKERKWGMRINAAGDVILDTEVRHTSK